MKSSNRRTIEYLHEECSGYELVWMSEIFDEVAERTKSKEFIQALREISIKYPTAAKEYNLKFIIDSAEEYAEKEQMVEIRYLKSETGLDNCFDLLFGPIWDYLPDGYKDSRPECPEYIYFTWLFKKYNLMSGTPEGKEIIWTIHWECSIKGMPFAMVYDRDYDIISFAVDEDHLSLKEPIAEELKRIIEEEYKRTQR